MHKKSTKMSMIYRCWWRGSMIMLRIFGLRRRRTLQQQKPGHNTHRLHLREGPPSLLIYCTPLYLAVLPNREIIEQSALGAAPRRAAAHIRYAFWWAQRESTSIFRAIFCCASLWLNWKHAAIALPRHAYYIREPRLPVATRREDGATTIKALSLSIETS